MARRKKQASASNRRNEAAISFIALGAAFLIAPAFLGKSPILAAFAALRPIGLLMLVAGGLLFWLSHRLRTTASQDATAKPVIPNGKTPTVPFESVQPHPVDRTTAELHRTAKQAIPEQPQRPTSWSAAVFDLIEWRRLEALVEALFQQAGFETKSQSHGADGGVDIWLYSRNMPGQPVSIVQCKHWNGKKVGVDKLRELRGVMASFKVQRGQFVTTSSYTTDALAFARENAINPLDSAGLLALIAKRTPEQQQALLNVALESDYWRPTCVNCGVKMVSRTPRGGGKDFWGCISFPKCKTTMPIRGA